jgi:hypothetical protein
VWHNFHFGYAPTAGRPYAAVLRPDKVVNQYWYDDFTLEKPLSPLELAIQEYIAAQKRELGLDA